MDFVKKKSKLSFFRPNIVAVCFLIILILPTLLNLLADYGFLSHNIKTIGIFPSNFSLLNTYLRINLLLVLFIVPGDEHIFGKVATIFIVIFIIAIILFVIWTIACFLGLLWELCFRIFREKAKRYERVAALSISIAFVLIAVILPIIGSSFIHVVKNTRQTIDIKKEGYITVLGSRDPIWSVPITIQELTLKNNFFMGAIYDLPDVTVCLYDTKGGSGKRVGISYYSLDSMDPTSFRPLSRDCQGCDGNKPPTNKVIIGDSQSGYRNTGVSLRKGEEKKIYLNVSRVDVRDENEDTVSLDNKYDLIFIFYNAKVLKEYGKEYGVDIYKKFCESLSDEDIKNAEKIKIEKL